MKYVRLLTFTLRHHFDAVKDPGNVDLLVDDYDEKFGAAYKGNYHKPKHHTIRHLSKYMKLYGPFRGVWTLLCEAFLQPLKRWLCVNQGPNSFLLRSERPCVARWQ